MKKQKRRISVSLRRVAIIAVSALAGALIHRFALPVPDGAAGGSEAEPAAEAKAKVWTCSMHPQIQLPKFGKCPICFMDLIPLEEGSGDEGERVVSIGEYAAKLMKIETAEVAAANPEIIARLTGRLAPDETRLAEIATRMPGRVEALYVNRTGMAVRKGDPLAEIYSPELISAQEELLQSHKTRSSLGENAPKILRDTADSTLRAAENKLRLLGLTEEQIAQIIAAGESSERITIYAPAGGVVLQKDAREGMYIEKGERILAIADLSTLWAELEAYESDLPGISLGSRVEFTTLSFPGRVFGGEISFINPILDQSTRTARVRVEVENLDSALKPGMFVKATVRSPAYGAGETEGSGPPLVIPASAALRTGKRAVVYVAVLDKEKPTYEGRTVTLGARAGDLYIVEEGLRAGERVVTRGAFILDAELQIQAKPSMMAEGSETPEAEAAPSEQPVFDNLPDSFASALQKAMQAYFTLQEALAADDFEAAGQSVLTLGDALAALEPAGLEKDAEELWSEKLMALNAALAAMRKSGGIEGARREFEHLSDTMIYVANSFPLPGLKIYKAYCPMAFDDKGAYWLQGDATLANPYFGSMMLRCGEIEELRLESKDESAVEK